jgi:hypothetical protein
MPISSPVKIARKAAVRETRSVGLLAGDQSAREENPQLASRSSKRMP